MGMGDLGKVYGDGDVIVAQGDEGDCMYVVQEGRAEVVRATDAGEVRLAVLEEGDVFGELALFERETRSATVRALGKVRMLTVDKGTFMTRIHEDPSLAFNVMQKMARNIRGLNEDITRLKSGC